jgi:chlorobactene glucosyltransferase
VNSLHLTLLVLYSCVLVVWLARHFAISLTRRTTPTLTLRDPRFAQDDPPLVSVLIPAKDEEGAIGECLESIVNQSYRRLEILVIDDRSEDGTASVVRNIATRDPRVRLISVQDLPPGWTGKTNALVTGVREARGEWLLFIDSDTRHAPDNLSILMEFVRRERADMVSVLPRWRNGSFWERVVQPLAGLLLILKSPPHRVNDDSDLQTAFANGQYILFRRKTYEAIGGHQSVREKFVEDIHLARAAKARGHRVRLVIAPELTSTRMYTSLGALARGWSRILYAGYDRSVLQLAGLLAGLVVFSLSAYGVVAGTAVGLAWGYNSPLLVTLFCMGLMHIALQSSVMARAYALTASDRGYVALYGAAAAIMVWVLSSAILKCFTRHVVWRGTTYCRLEDAQPTVLPLPAAPITIPDRRLKQSA